MAASGMIVSNNSNLPNWKGRPSDGEPFEVYGFQQLQFT